MTERTALYRLYDAGDELLYVGIADDPKIRFRRHRDEKPWWPQVAMKDIEWLADRETAQAEELRVIEGEMPRYNRQGVRWFHADLGDRPAEVLTMGEFRGRAARTIDRVAAGEDSLILTRRGVPLVVVVPYSQIAKGISRTVKRGAADTTEES
jgi:prevent-host-death family protein